MATIEIRYKCTCMWQEAAVPVPARNRDEDIRDWMTLVLTPSLYLHHRQNSPRCKATEMDYVKVPCDEETGAVGAKQEVH